MAVKHVENKLEPDKIGPLQTQPIRKRTANCEHFLSAKYILMGRWHGRQPVQVSIQCLQSYILLELGLSDVGKILAWTSKSQ